MAIISLTESQLKNVIKRVLKEYAGRDYTIVGYVKNSTVEYATGNYFVLVETDKLNVSDYGIIIKATEITKDKEGNGSSITGYLKSGLANFIELLPEYKGTIIEDVMLGGLKPQRVERSKELFNTLVKDGNYTVLTHNSNKKITDGVIKIGMPMNNWSISDFQEDGTPRAYYWGSNGGMDSTSGAKFKYFSKIPTSEIYPMGFGCNPDLYNSISDVEKAGYSAVGYYIQGQRKESGTVVSCFDDLPISEIQFNGKLYDGNWNQIN